MRSLAVLSPEFTKWLLAHGVDSDIANERGVTPSATAAIFNEIPTLDLLLANSAKMQASILHLAMRPTAYGGVDMVKHLILHSADVNHCDANSGTPLHCAAYFGLKDVVSEFLEAGVDPGMLVDSSTLANLAKQHDNLEVHELLVASPRPQIKSSNVRQG